MRFEVRKEPKNQAGLEREIAEQKDVKLGQFIVVQVLESARSKQELQIVKSKLDALGRGITSLLLK
ncbi:hypothetical protein ACKE5C_11030 [Aneurinibacillus thermoaerophilus]|jgi:hypothetical protein|uniref:Uncharacterized protein n=1 Tax=Aneurinibacillus thermoaerophilus TaxID=143495 RepID=A0ABX8Y7U9_ANETH|nr:hypothetical protein [Aneurinibacillus thermoaerophilus]QYY41449.1 hypothetical protein K3F53_10895 [Aneurinibacillus thermoaerophilus]